VVSLLPSATEMLVAVAGDQATTPGGGAGGVVLVGVSHECDWPPAVRRGVESGALPTLTRARTAFTSSAAVDAQVRAALGAGESLYDLDEELLAALKPDLIITQDLCNVCSIDRASVERAASKVPSRPAVLSLNPRTFEGVLDDVLRVGEAVGLAARAMEATVSLRGRACAAEDYVGAFAPRVSVAFLEWTDPLFVGGHWTPQMIERAGGEHPLNPTRPVLGAGAAEGPVGQSQREAGPSVVVTAQAVVETAPEVVIVCPCGLSLEQAERETRALMQQAWFRGLPAARAGGRGVYAADGNAMFSRPGPRLVEGLEFLVGVLTDRPEVIPAGFPFVRVG
jgi:ABC-type Fe3+-hydroxamate transport system substrate-binding protein